MIVVVIGEMRKELLESLCAVPRFLSGMHMDYCMNLSALHLCGGSTGLHEHAARVMMRPYHHDHNHP